MAHQLVYSHHHDQLYTYTCRIHIEAMKTSDTVLRKIYLSLYLKGFVWEGVGDRTELQYIDPHSYGHQRCVFLVLKGCLTGSPGAQLSAECWLSLPHLVSNSSDLKLTDFLSSPSYIIVQSPTQYLPIIGHRDESLPLSLEWHVWLWSSGNNCHAVHRSLSSGASVYDCTAGFYLVPYCQPSPPTPMEYATSTSLEWHVWPGRRSIYNTTIVVCILPKSIFICIYIYIYIYVCVCVCVCVCMFLFFSV